MQNFPELSETPFRKTRRQIHSVAKLISKFRETLVKPIAKNDNLFLKSVEQGFCTPPMNDLNELEIGCNLEKLIIEVANAVGKYKSFSINNKSHDTLCEELKSVLREFGVAADVEYASPGASQLNHSDIEANEFLTQFVNYSTLMSDFHKRINTGVKTQICLWPHDFDNAFKWFSGKKIDEQDEYMSIGVSNGDETNELPYVYMTLFPPLRKTNTLQIPEGATLHDYEWTGLILPYESVMEKKNIDEQKKLIDNFFEISFASIQRGFSKR